MAIALRVGEAAAVLRLRAAAAAQRLRLPGTLIRYLAVGVLNTIAGLGTIYLCLYAFGASDVLANAIGYAFGICLSFVLNKRWTFASRGDPTAELVKFVLVMALAYAANLAAVVGLIGLGANHYLSQALGIGPYVAVGYLGSRCLVFRAVGERGRQSVCRR